MSRSNKSRSDRKSSRDSWETDSVPPSPPHLPSIRRSGTTPSAYTRDSSIYSRSVGGTRNPDVPDPLNIRKRYGGAPASPSASSKYSQSVGGRRASRDTMGMEDRDLDMCPLSAIEEDSERSHFYLSRTSNLPPTRAPSHRRSITPFPAHQPISRSNTISEPPPPSREDIRHRREKFEQKKEEDRRDWDSHKSQRERDRYNTEKISMREKRDKKEKEQRDRERMEYVADTPPSRRDTDAKDKDGKTGGCTQQ